MALSPGDKLGPYEILEPIGAGGMGEVYCARDHRLERDVAIKVSQEQFSDRFEREARAVAALNHPNICTIYDVGSNYLVMELIEGVSPRGPLPLEDALRIARQIADGLGAAHEKGIIHRDLKPGNIKIKPDGTVKILDFGLVKTLELISGDPETSPTLTVSPTREGMIMGTAAYMSPEQARGKAVDKRADIWAFGVVLYELITGRRPFHGEDLTDTLASVMKDKPDLSRVPIPVRHLLEKCLEKDPSKRLRDIGDVGILVDARETRAPVRPGRRMYWAAAAALALVLGAGAVYLWQHRPAPELRGAQFTVDAPGGSTFVDVITGSAVSPDGRLLVFSARDKDAKNSVLWLRPIDSLNARSLSGTEHANFPFWSPDSQSLAFFAGDKLMRITIAGGSTPVTLCEAKPPGPGGGTWNREGLILFTGEDGLFRVPASGGVATRVTQADAGRHEMAHGFPQFLPDGRKFLYFIQSADRRVQGVYASFLDRPQERNRLLTTAHKALYTPPFGRYPGMLLWLREQALLAQAFDTRELKLEGEPGRLADNVSIAQTSMGPSGAAFWVSHEGVLAYRADSRAKRKILWVGRDGKEIGEAAEEDEYTSVRLSPDGRKALVGRIDALDRKNNLWLLDLARGVMTKLTVDGKENGFAVWSPDSRSIAYTSELKGVLQIFRKDAFGGGKEEQLTDDLDPSYVTNWSRDGRYLFCTRVQGNSNDIWVLPLDGGGPAGQRPFVAVHINAYGGSAAISPDGKWMAYHSAESGRTEVYVRPFVEALATKTSAWQVSREGGVSPRWRADGKELFYLSPEGAISAATVTPASRDFGSDAPHELFKLTGGRRVSSDRGYDVSSDGQRCLLVAANTTNALLAASATGAASASPLIVMLHWQAGLKK